MGCAKVICSQAIISNRDLFTSHIWYVALQSLHLNICGLTLLSLRSPLPEMSVKEHHGKVMPMKTHLLLNTIRDTVWTDFKY